MPIPALTDLGQGFTAAIQDIALIARVRQTEPERAAARLWDLLWRIVAGRATEEGAPQVDDLVQSVERLVRRNLAGTLSVGEVAHALDISPSQLNRRLVRAGAGPFGVLVRRMRMETASHLILRSDLHMVEIASRCGLGDAQHFNKAVRQALGASPRALRRSMGGP